MENDRREETVKGHPKGKKISFFITTGTLIRIVSIILLILLIYFMIHKL
ncbi:hypothetical protein [Megasphaera vaginalis (ex Bordigoni et al. 2020)]|nr:hypothetical protein [Megasphaera vaginalis (ex Bordigoni et al. 2020)]